MNISSDESVENMLVINYFENYIQNFTMLFHFKLQYLNNELINRFADFFLILEKILCTLYKHLNNVCIIMFRFNYLHDHFCSLVSIREKVKNYILF